MFLVGKTPVLGSRSLGLMVGGAHSSTTRKKLDCQGMQGTIGGTNFGVWGSKSMKDNNALAKQPMKVALRTQNKILWPCAFIKFIIAKINVAIYKGLRPDARCRPAT